MSSNAKTGSPHNRILGRRDCCDSGSTARAARVAWRRAYRGQSVRLSSATQIVVGKGHS